MRKLMAWQLVLFALTSGGIAPYNALAQMKIGWQTSDTNVLLLHAVETGMFTKEQLDVKLLPFSAGPPMLPALAANELDVAWLGDFPTISGFANGLPIEIFTLKQEYASHVRVVAHPDAGIGALRDLRGKTIGVTYGSSGHYHILRALANAGLSQADVTLVNLQPANMPGAFAAKQVDVICTWEPNVGNLLKQGGISVATSESLGVLLATVWVARKQYSRNNPEQIQKFLRVLDKARQAYDANRREVIKADAKRLKLSEDEMLQLIDRQGRRPFTFEEQMTPRMFGKPGDELNSRFMTHVRGVANFLLELKRVQTLPADWRGMINREPMTTYRTVVHR